MVDWFTTKYITIAARKENMHATRGRVHDFLGMNFHYDGKGSVCVTMHKFIDSIINEFPYNKKESKASTPAAAVLFQIREHTENLSPEKAQIFHTFVAKLLYLAKHTRPDIAIAVAFLLRPIIRINSLIN